MFKMQQSSKPPIHSDMMGPATRSSASVEAFCVLKRGSSDTLYLSHMSAASNRAGDGTGHTASTIS